MRVREPPREDRAGGQTQQVVGERQRRKGGAMHHKRGKVRDHRPCRAGGAGNQTKVAEAVGSGFVVSHDGYIVTNNHVISLDREGQADEVTVKLSDGKQYKARIVGRDPESDIALLKIDAGNALPFVKFGDSTKARAGDWIIAIGNPFGLGGTVTSGIISSVNRNTGTGAYDHYIQTDASINSGNSGDRKSVV